MESVKLTASDGYELCLNIYEAQKPKACIQILHGMEEHQGRYRDFAGMLADAGYTAITSDMRGHGANAPVFGFFKEKNGWKYLLDDQKRITAYIRERYGVEKIAVFAHSMGTIIARNLLQCESHNYSKVILSGYPYCPAILPLGIFLAKTIKAFRGPEYVSTWMQTLALGDFNLKLGETKTEYDWLSANEKNVQSYIEDPLCGHVFTISGFCDLFALLKNMNNPDNYNENGTTKKGARKWVRSKHYLALQAELADLKRRGVETRRNIHGRVVRILVGSAGTIRVEENNWKALQRGRYGKSVLNGAPSEFIERLRRTAESAGSKVILVNPRKLKPSQHDPMSGTFMKHELWERRCRLGDTSFFVDRDVMAALNLLHADVTTNSYDSEALARALQTSKQYWLDASVVVELKTANRTSEREQRRFLRRGLKSVSVERLHPHSFLRGVGPRSLASGAIVSDACPEEASSDADDGQERPPTSETL